MEPDGEKEKEHSYWNPKKQSKRAAEAGKRSGSSFEAKVEDGKKLGHRAKGGGYSPKKT